MTPAIRVLLVEDNEVYRTTLELLLAGRAGIEIVGSPSPTGARPPRRLRASTPTSS